jgi:hypothetical protein
MRLAQAADLSVIMFIPRVFIYLALVAWATTFVAMIISLISSGKRRESNAFSC